MTTTTMRNAKAQSMGNIDEHNDQPFPVDGSLIRHPRLACDSRALLGLCYRYRESAGKIASQRHPTARSNLPRSPLMDEQPAAGYGTRMLQVVNGCFFGKSRSSRRYPR